MNTSTLLERWRRQQRLPGGRRLFSLALARVVPFVMRLKPMVLELEAGRAVVRMADRRPIHNHLGQISPSAVMTLGEYTGLLAINAGLADGETAHVTSLHLEVLRPGTGGLVAECRVDGPESMPARVRIVSESGAEQAVVLVGWTTDAEAALAGGPAAALDAAVREPKSGEPVDPDPTAGGTSPKGASALL